MQSVSDSFSVEEMSSVRKIAGSLLVSWKKDNLLTNTTFTIGVSLIGGPDVIGANPGAVGSPGQWRYFDESPYLLGMAWERGLNMPIGGLTKAMGEARLDNTSERFTPRYMGGSSELYTAILPRRPMIINAGFNFDGVDQTLPQFAGILDRAPELSVRRREMRLHAADYIDFFQNRYLDKTVMFTAQRTDQVIESLFSQLGMSTSQYELDVGINTIPFGLFEKGTRFSDIMNQLVQAEYGHLYQDELGKFRFENRHHWSTFPHFNVERVIPTAQVIEAEAPDMDHLINVVEMSGQPRAKQPRQLLFKLSATIPVEAGVRKEIFIDYEDPVLQIDTVNITANTDEFGGGSSITIVQVARDDFAKASKLILESPTDGFITNLEIFGRPARVIQDFYYRAQDDSSVTAYEERPYAIRNDYIQDVSWANSLAQLILDDFSEVENLQRITIRAIPELQLGDLISWQGRYWRVFGIKATLAPSVGFVQELTLLQRTIQTYFRIGISTIGGSDAIAP